MKTCEHGWPSQIALERRASPESAAGALAEAVAHRLGAALAERDRASLVVSGGSTPIAFFKTLRQADLAWSRVVISLADERWLAARAERSNERLVRDHLLQGPAAEARFIGLKQPHDSADAGQPEAAQALGEVPWPLDVLVLGMGNDGHTASLFPDAPELSSAMAMGQGDRCIAMHPPSQSEPRISLTRQALSESRWIALHLQGRDKLETLERAVAGLEDVEQMPIRAFLSRGLTLFWSP